LGWRFRESGYKDNIIIIYSSSSEKKIKKKKRKKQKQVMADVITIIV